MTRANSDVIKNDLGRKVRELRLSRKLTQNELAIRIGAYQEFVSDIERGLANPTLENIIKIAAALDVRMKELFGGADDRALKRKRTNKLVRHSKRTDTTA